MSIKDNDTESNWTAMTPAGSATIHMEDNEDGDLLKEEDPFSITSSIPWPGNTYIISHSTTSSVLTLHNGRIILTSPGGNQQAGYHWDCVDNNGWLGFRNRVSGKWLGYDKGHNLVCVVGRPQEWEQFCARPHPEGGFVLMMTHWHALRPVGVDGGGKVKKLDNGKVQDGTVWKFVKV